MNITLFTLINSKLIDKNSHIVKHTIEKGDKEITMSNVTMISLTTLTTTISVGSLKHYS